MNSKTLISAGAIALLALPALAQQQTMKPEETEVWEPEPRMVATAPDKAPSDAIVLFDGASLDQWVSGKDGSSPAGWEVADGAFTVVKGTGEIRTKQEFSDYQLHVEWRSPTEIVGEGQGRGNSGIFMQGLYELQVLDSYNNRTYSNGQAASLYKQRIPLVNATKPPGEWQAYDVIWTAPRFNADGILVSKARITVIHNGVLVQNNVELDGPTEYIGIPKYKAHGPGPIVLQDHGNPVSFRNIWIRPL
ncbi:3-keto-disaccharide hydrolase [Parapedobacter sp. DT-150]|uniref:3-keto-disaccharide hydrolase n=1 Tax=Parapedobacter sp. DT-150 TaxID=3396162 RepID=UPI003F194280